MGLCLHLREYEEFSIGPDIKIKFRKFSRVTNHPGDLCLPSR